MMTTSEDNRLQHPHLSTNRLIIIQMVKAGQFCQQIVLNIDEQFIQYTRNNSDIVGDLVLLEDRI